MGHDVRIWSSIILYYCQIFHYFRIVAIINWNFDTNNFPILFFVYNIRHSCNLRKLAFYNMYRYVVYRCEVHLVIAVIKNSPYCFFHKPTSELFFENYCG